MFAPACAKLVRPSGRGAWALLLTRPAVTARETSYVARGGWFEYGANGGGSITYLRRRRYQPFRPFHTMELNAAGWAALFGAALPLAALLLFVAQLPLWLSIAAAAMAALAIAIVLDRRKEAASWVGRVADLTETELQTVVAELQALGIEVELSRQIIDDLPENSGETQLVLRHRHRNRRAVEQALAARRRDH